MIPGSGVGAVSIIIRSPVASLTDENVNLIPETILLNILFAKFVIVTS